MESISQILTNIGYTLADRGMEYRTRPIYRESNNDTSLRIDKRTGRFVDFSANISGSFEELIKLTLNLTSLEDAREWIQNKDAKILERHEERPLLREKKIFDDSFVKNLEQDHSHWNKRGISTETVTLFGGGVCREGKMNGRYVFPIYDSRKRLIGVSGRDLYNFAGRAKWKHIGSKAEWIYPFFVNYQDVVKANEIILVESIGDMLALWEAGIKNTLVLFGVDLASPRVAVLLKTNPKRIIVALNNDNNNGSVGNKATTRIINRLSNHFDRQQLINGIPAKKDFGEMTKEEILLWQKQLS